MPINTSMHRWWQIASDMDIEKHPIDNRFNSITKTAARHRQHDDKVQASGGPSKSNLQRLPGKVY